MVQIIKLITIFIHSNHSEKRMCWGSVSFLSQISRKYRCVSNLVSVWLLFTKLAWNMFFCSCPRNLKCNNFEFCFTARLTILKSEKVYSWSSKINLLNLKMIQIQRRACVFCCRCRKWWNVQKNEPFLNRVHFQVLFQNPIVQIPINDWSATLLPEAQLCRSWLSGVLRRRRRYGLHRHDSCPRVFKLHNW